MVILCVVINMKNKEKLILKLYFAFSVLLLTSICIVVYTSWRNGSKTHKSPYDAGSSQLSQEKEDLSENILEAGQIRTPAQADEGEWSGSDGGLSGDPLTVATDMIYYLKVTDGYLQVYEKQSGTLYMETEIAYALLPARVQQQIDEGKYFTSEEALLEFLENYSS